LLDNDCLPDVVEAVVVEDIIGTLVLVLTADKEGDEV
jgi:hypothetical protein